MLDLALVICQVRNQENNLHPFDEHNWLQGFSSQC